MIPLSILQLILGGSASSRPTTQPTMISPGGPNDIPESIIAGLPSEDLQRLKYILEQRQSGIPDTPIPYSIPRAQPSLIGSGAVSTPMNTSQMTPVQRLESSPGLGTYKFASVPAAEEENYMMNQLTGAGIPEPIAIQMIQRFGVENLKAQADMAIANAQYQGKEMTQGRIDQRQAKMIKNQNLMAEKAQKQKMLTEDLKAKKKAERDLIIDNKARESFAKSYANLFVQSTPQKTAEPKELETLIEQGRKVFDEKVLGAGNEFKKTRPPADEEDIKLITIAVKNAGGLQQALEALEEAPDEAFKKPGQRDRIRAYLEFLLAGGIPE